MQRTLYTLFFLAVSNSHGLADQTKISEALRGLEAKDDATVDASIAYLKEHYPEAKSRMLAALDCEKGRFSDALAYTFSKIGKSVIPDLVGAIPHSTQRQKVNLIDALRQLGANAKSAVPALLTQLHSKDIDIRLAVLEAFGTILEPTSVPAIVDCLKDKDRRIRGAAVDALLHLGAEAHPAGPALIQFVKSEIKKEPEIVREAAWCLGQIGRRAIPLLDREILDESNSVETRRVFLHSFSDMANWASGDCKLAIPTLKRAYGDPDPSIREAIISDLHLICRISESIDPDKELGWFFKLDDIKALPAKQRIMIIGAASAFPKYRPLAISLLDEGLRSKDKEIIQMALANSVDLLDDLWRVASALAPLMRHEEMSFRYISFERVSQHGDFRYIACLPAIAHAMRNDEDPTCRLTASKAFRRVIVSLFSLPIR